MCGRVAQAKNPTEFGRGLLPPWAKDRKLAWKMINACANDLRRIVEAVWGLAALR